MEDRKMKEVQHSDFRRSIVSGYEYLTDGDQGRSFQRMVQNPEEYEKHFSNMKFYSIAGSSFRFRDEFLLGQIKDRVVLDYCCGNGEIALFMAKNGAARSFGIDLSPVAIENAKRHAEKEGISAKTEFLVMDAEKMDFPDDMFDLVHVYGAMHHLDFEKGIKEIRRIVKPTGEIICVEALGHNPLFHLYRKMTPHLRTAWEMEHIIRSAQIDLANKYFSVVSRKYFHLFSLLAVPFRKKKCFPRLLGFLEKFDDFLLRIPYVQRMAWIVIFTLSGKKYV